MLFYCHSGFADWCELMYSSTTTALNPSHLIVGVQHYSLTWHTICSGSDARTKTARRDRGQLESFRRAGRLPQVRDREALQLCFVIKHGVEARLGALGIIASPWLCRLVCSRKGVKSVSAIQVHVHVAIRLTLRPAKSTRKVPCVFHRQAPVLHYPARRPCRKLGLGPVRKSLSSSGHVTLHTSQELRACEVFRVTSFR